MAFLLERMILLKLHKKRRTGRGAAGSLRRALLVGIVGALAAVPAARADAPAAESAQLSITGHVARTTVRNGQSIRFWVVIENQSDSPVRHIRLAHIDPAQLKIVRRCWGPGKDAGCSPQPATSDVCQAPASDPPDGGGAAPSGEPEICAYLAPHESFTVWGDLAAETAVSRQESFAAFEWRGTGGWSLTATSLGEVQSLSWLRWFWYSLLHKWELGVPTLLVILGGAIATWRRWHEAKGARLRELEDNRSKTWNLMLRDSHRVALRYYMPIANGLASSFHEICRYHDGNSADAGVAESAFYYLLRFHWEVRRTARELGAYYFKNRTAEFLVECLFQEHRRRMGLNDPALHRLLDQCLNRISAKTTLDDLSNMITGKQAEMVAMWNHVGAWLPSDACKEDLDVLEGYLQILIFEANRPYLHWYGSQQPLALSSRVRAVVEFVGWRNGKGKATDEYVTEASRG